MSEAAYSLEFYETARGTRPALEFIRTLDDRARAKISRSLRRLEEFGPNLQRPAADVLSGAIRELRVSFGHDSFRFIFFVHGRYVVVTQGFRKKTDRVDPGEIARAERCRTDWLVRNEVQP